MLRLGPRLGGAELVRQRRDDQARHHRRQHPGGVHQLRRQIGGVRGDQEGHVDGDGLVEATKSRVGDRGDGDPDEDPTEKRDHGHARDVPRCVLAAERQADGDGVDHQGGAVVGEALGLQQHELAAGQALGQGGRGGGVGRGDGGTQDQGRLPRDPERRHDPRHGEGGGHHEHRRGDQDAAQVASDGVLGGGEALPEQQAREEQQQHHLGGHVKAFQAGYEGQREPEEDLRQRHRKTQLGGQGVARHHRNPDSDRDDETLHAPPFPDFPRRIPRLEAGPVELSPMSPNRKTG